MHKISLFPHSKDVLLLYYTKYGGLKMAKHTETSWKPKKPINQLHNAVDRATNALKQAQSHPSEQLIQQAQNAIERAENGVMAAFLTAESQEPFDRLEEQLDIDREQFEQLQPMKDES
jgi:hypothetical protein